MWGSMLQANCSTETSSEFPILSKYQISNSRCEDWFWTWVFTKQNTSWRFQCEDERILHGFCIGSDSLDIVDKFHSNASYIISVDSSLNRSIIARIKFFPGLDNKHNFSDGTNYSKFHNRSGRNNGLIALSSATTDYIHITGRHSYQLTNQTGKCERST